MDRKPSAVRFPLHSDVSLLAQRRRELLRETQKKRLKRGVFRSLQELKDAIHRFLDDTNANPKPFTWTKDPNKIIAAVKRGHQSLIRSTSYRRCANRDHDLHQATRLSSVSAEHSRHPSALAPHSAVPDSPLRSGASIITEGGKQEAKTFCLTPSSRGIAIHRLIQ